MGDRVDYVLQERELEVTNKCAQSRSHSAHRYRSNLFLTQCAQCRPRRYLFALLSHVSYWQSEDVVRFIVTAITNAEAGGSHSADYAYARSGGS